MVQTDPVEKINRGHSLFDQVSGLAFTATKESHNHTTPSTQFVLDVHLGSISSNWDLLSGLVSVAHELKLR
jgi:hypothetical protein